MFINKWGIKSATVTFLVAAVTVTILACLPVIWFVDFNIGNMYGFLALALYGLSLMPSNGAVLLLINLFPFNTKGFLDFLIKLRKYRRQIGVAAFGFSLHHGVIILHQQAPSWQSDLSLFSICLKYWHGLILMAIMFMLTITSNNWSVKSLGQYWVWLHRLTYPMAFLILYHIVDKMGLQWTLLTPVCLAISIIILSLLMYRFLANVLYFDEATISYCKRIIKAKSKQKGFQ